MYVKCARRGGAVAAGQTVSSLTLEGSATTSTTSGRSVTSVPDGFVQLVLGAVGGAAPAKQDKDVFSSPIQAPVQVRRQGTGILCRSRVQRQAQDCESKAKQSQAKPSRGKGVCRKENARGGGGRRERGVAV